MRSTDHHLILDVMHQTAESIWAKEAQNPNTPEQQNTLAWDIRRRRIDMKEGGNDIPHTKEEMATISSAKRLNVTDELLTACQSIAAECFDRDIRASRDAQQDELHARLAASKHSKSADWSIDEIEAARGLDAYGDLVASLETIIDPDATQTYLPIANAFATLIANLYVRTLTEARAMDIATGKHSRATAYPKALAEILSHLPKTYAQHFLIPAIKAKGIDLSHAEITVESDGSSQQPGLAPAGPLLAETIKTQCKNAADAHWNKAAEGFVDQYANAEGIFGDRRRFEEVHVPLRLLEAAERCFSLCHQLTFQTNRSNEKARREQFAQWLEPNRKAEEQLIGALKNVLNPMKDKTRDAITTQYAYEIAGKFYAHVVSALDKTCVENTEAFMQAFEGMVQELPPVFQSAILTPWMEHNANALGHDTRLAPATTVAGVLGQGRATPDPRAFRLGKA